MSNELIIKINRPQKLNGVERKLGECFEEFDPGNPDHQRLLRQGFLVVGQKETAVTPKKVNK
jgi:hypothetical protein